ncbi:hypothetical protein CPLU01_06370 [Colletotrichum plurivorum]|uniref:Uncharacterized protein n=1 Tax=Colletotrichum plurivorum TaxID=2175906 RepID=A0A8H6KII2_9PEZI|nr:hypothetical protein CPLU01_06370 [Colletotrichum plurivorum]
MSTLRNYFQNGLADTEHGTGGNRAGRLTAWIQPRWGRPGTGATLGGTLGAWAALSRALGQSFAERVVRLEMGRPSVPICDESVSHDRASP